MSLLDDLTAAPPHARFAVLVRHAARPPVTSPRDFLEAPLTPEGEAAAHELGRRLADAGFGLLAHHSPVHRCAQTAAAMAAGAASTGKPAHVLGAVTGIGPVYVYDPLWALPEYLAGGNAFIRRWFDGQLPPERIAPRREATRLQLAGIVQAWTRQDASTEHNAWTEPNTATLSVFVTHDWNILALREELLGLRFEDVGWIGYLEGVVLSLADGVVRVHTLGESAEVLPELLV